MLQIPIIILAAGASSRLGSAKQLLPWGNSTLIEHTVQTALASRMGNVYVVLGANIRQIKPKLQHLPVSIVINRKFMDGISTSIQAGLTKVLKDDPETDAVVLCLADQPFLTPQIITQLAITHYTSKLPLIHCQYARHLTGPPSLIQRKYFSYLKKLTGDTGAKKIFSQFPDDVGIVEFEKGQIDIDSWEDYAQLK